MSRFSGAQHKGASREAHAERRAEAEARSVVPAEFVPWCGHRHGWNRFCPPLPVVYREPRTGSE